MLWQTIYYEKAGEILAKKVGVFPDFFVGIEPSFSLYWRKIRQ